MFKSEGSHAWNIFQAYTNTTGVQCSLGFYFAYIFMFKKMKFVYIREGERAQATEDYDFTLSVASPSLLLKQRKWRIK